MSTKIVPHEFYEHPEGGKPRVSLFTSYVPEGYVLVSKGWTTENEDGTYGNGRFPFESKEEGEAWLARYEERTGRPYRGMSGFTS